mmetsp:Transcript_135910/g.434820  ORF Transcript_135910/g.434820 Transcript_135910/m.434820 type:complete len:229 (-) Transcript_135910:1460-2146(-)
MQGLKDQGEPSKIGSLDASRLVRFLHLSTDMAQSLIASTRRRRCTVLQNATATRAVVFTGVRLEMQNGRWLCSKSAGTCRASRHGTSREPCGHWPRSTSGDQSWSACLTLRDHGYRISLVSTWHSLLGPSPRCGRSRRGCMRKSASCRSPASLNSSRRPWRISVGRPPRFARKMTHSSAMPPWSQPNTWMPVFTSGRMSTPLSLGQWFWHKPEKSTCFTELQLAPSVV